MILAALWILWWSCGAVMLSSINVKESGALQLAEMLHSRLLEIGLGPGAQCYVVAMHPLDFCSKLVGSWRAGHGEGGSRYSMNYH